MDRGSARKILDVLRGIVDAQMAVAFLRSELSRMGDDEAALVLGELSAAAETDSEESRRALLLVTTALAQRESSELRAAIARAADRFGDHDLSRRLVPRPRDEDESTRVVPDFGKGRPLTLGERKSLARRRDRNLIARVLRDPHPDVIEILLGNPALTETDVVRLCARRPVPGEVLREVARSPRWIRRPAVRVAIAKNPHAPVDLALGLVPHLDRVTAGEIAAHEGLAPELREACERHARPLVLMRN